MADAKVSAFTAVGTPALTDEVAVVQGGLSKRESLTQILSLIAAASTTVVGTIEIATLAEVTTGTDTVRAVTPQGLKQQTDLLAPKASPVFTTAVTLPVGLTGVIRADSGVVSVDADVTDVVAAASTAAAGKIEIATLAEVTTGTDTARAVTPAGVRQEINTVLTPISTVTITADLVTTPGSARFDLNEWVPAKTFALGDLASQSTQYRLVYARLATNAALPACTYNNSGSGGPGATLTADANGAAAAVDGVTPVAGDIILVRNQAAPLQNGPYYYSQIGTAGTPFILTRLGSADENANYTWGVTVRVMEGIVWAGSEWSLRGTVTIGTTSLVWDCTQPPTATRGIDVYSGPSRAFRTIFSDLDEFTTTVAVGSSGLVLPGSQVGFVLTGTDPTATQTYADSVAGVQGVAALATGTAATNTAFVTSANGLNASQSGVILDSAKRYSMATRYKTTTLTTGAQTFVERIGFMDYPANPYSGAFWELPKTASELGFANGNWQAVAMKLNTAQTGQSFIRTAASTVVTFTSTAHGLAVGDGVYVSASTDTAALPITVLGAAPYYVQTVADANTFTVVGVNAGTTTAQTATIQRSVRTIVDTTATETAATWRNKGLRYDPITGAVIFYSSVQTVSATISTNLPNGGLSTTLYPFAGLAKSVGATSRTMSIDWIAAVMPDDRFPAWA